MQIMVKLAQLAQGKANVRQQGDEARVEELAASIKARGVLQPLGVIAARKRQHYEVVYGGRRLQALQLLASRGDIPADTEVPCTVRPKETAFEDSLAENVNREQMHPLDECEAFRKLVHVQGVSEEDVASRFGYTVRHVQQRLRLAGLAPQVADAYRERRITLDVAQAFATTADQGMQAEVFNRLASGYAGFHTETVKRLIAEAGVSGTNRLALFVGREAYEAAGGVVEDALFTDQVTFRDRALLQRLADEKAAATATDARERLGVGEVRVVTGGHGVPWEDRKDLHYAPMIKASTPELEAEYEGIAARIDELTDGGERSEDELDEPQLEELRALEVWATAIDAGRTAYAPEVRANAVAFLVVDENGELVETGELFIPRQPATPPEPSSDRGSVPTLGAEADGSGGEAAPKPFKPSAALSGELADQRRQILGAALAQSPDLAYDLTVFRVATLALGGYGIDTHGDRMGLSATVPPGAVFGVRHEDTLAAASEARSRDALDLTWLDHRDRVASFEAFRRLDGTMKASILACAVARTLEPTHGPIDGGDRCSALHDHLGQVMGITVHEWWRPTAANYFDRVSKGAALATLGEFGGHELLGRYGGSKKGELSAAMEKLCAGNAIVEADVRNRALAWVPPLMGFGDAPQVEEGQTDDGFADPDRDEDAAAEAGSDADPEGQQLAA